MNQYMITKYGHDKLEETLKKQLEMHGKLKR